MVSPPRVYRLPMSGLLYHDSPGLQISQYIVQIEWLLTSLKEDLSLVYFMPHSSVILPRLEVARVRPPRVVMKALTPPVMGWSRMWTRSGLVFYADDRNPLGVDMRL